MKVLKRTIVAQGAIRQTCGLAQMEQRFLCLVLSCELVIRVLVSTLATLTHPLVAVSRVGDVHVYQQEVIAKRISEYGDILG